MNEEYQEFATRFAKAIIDENITAAHALFAPWLQKQVSVESLRADIEKWLLDSNDVWELDELIYPDDCRVSWNNTGLASLRENPGWRAPRSIPNEVTDENFRQWLVIQFLPDEDDERIEFDAWFDFWFILVDTADSFRIGFYEIAHAD